MDVYVQTNLIERSSKTDVFVRFLFIQIYWIDLDHITTLILPIYSKKCILWPTDFDKVIQTNLED